MEQVVQRLVFTLSAPSGTGKDTVARALVESDGALTFFATATTRPPRQGEQNGVDYHFLTREQFEQRIHRGDLLEWISYNDNYYGTLKSVILGHMQDGQDVISDITWHGAKAMKAFLPDAHVAILLMPPSYEALMERFNHRQLTSGEADDAKLRRLQQIGDDLLQWKQPGYVFTNPDLEGSRVQDYDYVVVNADLDKTLAKMRAILKDERRKRGF